MRIPLHVTGLDREKRFVDFSVAGPPTTAGTQAHKSRPVSSIAQTAKHAGKPKPKSKPAAKAGPTIHPKKAGKFKPKRRR
jgi:hypothetical protein